MDGEIFCYIHQGGELVKVADGSVEYKGGRNNSMTVDPNISYDQFVSQLCSELNIEAKEVNFHFTVKFDPSCMLPLHDDASLARMFKFNDMFCRVYVSPHADVNAVSVPPTRCSGSLWERTAEKTLELLSSGPAHVNTNVDPSMDISQTPVISSNSAHVDTHGNTNVDPPTDISDDQPRIQSSAETTCMDQLNSSQSQNAITSRGQIFSNAASFRDALYLMALAGKFRYSFKRNSAKHITVVCRVDECPWKITCRAIGFTNVVQVFTFRNVHNHSLEDVTSYKPMLSSHRASLVIDKAIRSNPDYHPRQICEDFIKQHGMQLSYSQAWHLKEKAKERIYGLPKNYYKLLPWTCERIVEKNPGSIVELTHSSDGRFERLFIAHAISIHGFTMGCRPIIAIDSSHMSGPCNDALFSATSYDANDFMFPLAIGVMSSENYEDWIWFLENLKKITGDKEVVIISDRRPALLRSVPEIFGIVNHAHCYHHLKEDFSNFWNKNNIKGNKGKENALQWLDSIAHARLEHDYNVRMCELRRFNDALAIWVEDNAPEHWAMSKFPKKRWDKLITNFDESFTVWLRDERHYSICHFIMEHMDKLATILVKNKEESTTWEGSVGPKIKEKVMLNISKGEKYPVTLLMNGIFRICTGMASLNVDIMNQTCTCKAWQMLGIPCEHACAALLSTGQNIFDFVENCYKFPNQELIYSGSFRPIETHDMPSVDNDGVVRDLTGRIFSSLNPPRDAKRPMGRPRKKRIESPVMDRGTLFCSQCHKAGHNRKTCKRLMLVVKLVMDEANKARDKIRQACAS